MLNLSTPKRLAAFEQMIQSNLKSKILTYMTRQDVQPSYANYQALNTALQSGDAPMDKVMLWMLKDPKQHRKYFETALYKGLDKLPHDIPELSEFFNLVEQKPTWYDQAKIDQAIQFTHGLGVNNAFILRDLSLMAGYMFPGFNQPLILTGALKKHAATRLAETTKWWVDVTEPNGFDRFSTGFTSTIYVRFIHALVRHQLQKSDKWDAETWGLPINQYDQAMTNIAFSGVVLIGIRALGIFPTRQEVDSFLHFWKYTGWLMGVSDPWLVDKEAEGWKLMYWMQFAHPQSDDSSVMLCSSLSQEPFERNYSFLPQLQRRLAYRQHLELTQFFIGRKKMAALGLPPRGASWYAYYLIAKNITLYSGAKYIPQLKNLLQKKGRQQQLSGLTLYQQQTKQLASMHQ